MVLPVGVIEKRRFFRHFSNKTVLSVCLTVKSVSCTVGNVGERGGELVRGVDGGARLAVRRVLDLEVPRRAALLAQVLLDRRPVVAHAPAAAQGTQVTGRPFALLYYMYSNRLKFNFRGHNSFRLMISVILRYTYR